MNRIKIFIKTYFYYNRQELKAIYTLLALIIVISTLSTIFSWYVLPEPIYFEQKIIDELNLNNKSEYNKTEKSDYNTYLKFENNKNKNYKSSQYISDSNKVKKTFSPLNINKADSVQLIALYRIGPVLASKIIQYRNKLGGFFSLNQLTEIWGFDPDILYDLEGKIYVNPEDIKIINLNTISIDELKTHPYFKFKLSQAIVNYRNQHGLFKNLSDLKNIKIVNDSIINLIKPYCFIE